MHAESPPSTYTYLSLYLRQTCRFWCIYSYALQRGSFYSIRYGNYCQEFFTFCLSTLTKPSSHMSIAESVLDVAQLTRTLPCSPLHTVVHTSRPFRLCITNHRKSNHDTAVSGMTIPLRYAYAAKSMAMLTSQRRYFCQPPLLFGGFACPDRCRARMFAAGTVSLAMLE